MNTPILKLGLLSVLLLVTLSIKAQGQRGQGQKTMPQFNAENASGILTYKYKKVVKKTKLKKAKKKRRVEKIISDYNHSIDQIKVLHADEFRATERFVTKKRKQAMANKDRQAMRFIELDARKQLIHIKKKVLKAEQLLNDELKLVFSEKQYHKWLDYQRSKKEGLKPKRPNNNANKGKSRQGGF